MSWRRFTALVDGLSAKSVFRIVSRGTEGQRKRPLTAKDAPAFFASFPKRGKKPC